MTRWSRLLVTAVGDAARRVAQWLLGKLAGPEDIVDLGKGGSVEHIEEIGDQIDRGSGTDGEALRDSDIYPELISQALAVPPHRSGGIEHVGSRAIGEQETVSIADRRRPAA